jgi:hypothetical protein
LNAPHFWQLLDSISHAIQIASMLIGLGVIGFVAGWLIALVLGLFVGAIGWGLVGGLWVFERVGDTTRYLSRLFAKRSNGETPPAARPRT